MSVTPLDLLERLRRDWPGAPLRSLLRDIDAAADKLWRRRLWLTAATETSFTTSLSFDNLTVTNGDATVVDGDSGGLFHADHVGLSFTIDDVVYTVGSITSGNSLELDEVYAGSTATGVAGELPRVVYTLPANFSSLREVRTAGGRYVFTEPQSFVLTGPDGSNLYAIDWLHSNSLNQELPGGDDDIEVAYWRKRTASFGASMSTAVDVPVHCEEALYCALVVQVLSRSTGTPEEQMRLRTQKGIFEEVMKEALREDGRRWAHGMGMNAVRL